MISITDEIKDFIENNKCKPDLFLKDDKPKQVILIDDKPKQVNSTTEIDDKKNDCLTIPIDIKDEKVEISKTLDKNSIIEVMYFYSY